MYHPPTPVSTSGPLIAQRNHAIFSCQQPMKHGSGAQRKSPEILVIANKKRCHRPDGNATLS
ncbi:hypothetical protein BTHE_1958 [Bifidobacterium thermophilum]|nr:hypothetical protein BTHE_1958 [Bifidobacterium thermophilum]